MTHRERFLAAIRLEKPDRVPMFDFLFQQPMYEVLIGRKPEVYNATDAWLLMDYERICLALYDDPGILTECFKMSVEFSKEAARRSVDAGCGHPPAWA